MHGVHGTILACELQRAKPRTLAADAICSRNKCTFTKSAHARSCACYKNKLATRLRVRERSFNDKEKEKEKESESEKERDI